MAPLIPNFGQGVQRSSVKSLSVVKENSVVLLESQRVTVAFGPLQGCGRAHHTGLYTRHGSKDGSSGQSRGSFASAVPVLV